MLSRSLLLLLVAILIIDMAYAFSMMVIPPHSTSRHHHPRLSSLRSSSSCQQKNHNDANAAAAAAIVTARSKIGYIHRPPTPSSFVLYMSTSSVSSSPLKVIISGAPASGKGTQCEAIIEKYGLVHLSTGDILRKAVSDQTPVGLLAKQYMDSGRLVPDDVIISIVQERLQEDDCQNSGWLLDGFPRTKEQAKALADNGITADIFVFLQVPDEILIERVVGRRLDPVTNKIYHLTFSPPPTDVMDRLIHRSDDTAEKAMVRLQQFHTNVNAIKDSYQHISTIIDGSQSPITVSQQIMNAIESTLQAKQTS